MVVITYTLLSLYALWLFYLAVMNLYRAKKDSTISKVALVLGYPILIVGVLLDLIVNVVIMSIVFLELPRELLVTQRLTRLIQSGFSWRANLAYWICHHFLNAFDPSGDHCD
jgi:hypothetical protein